MSKQNVPYTVGNWMLNGTILAAFILTMTVVVENLTSPLSSGLLIF